MLQISTKIKRTNCLIYISNLLLFATLPIIVFNVNSTIRKYVQQLVNGYNPVSNKYYDVHL